MWQVLLCDFHYDSVIINDTGTSSRHQIFILNQRECEFSTHTWAQPLKKRLGPREVNPFSSGEVCSKRGTYTYYLHIWCDPDVQVTEWDGLTILFTESHIVIGKCVKASSLGTFSWKESSVWEKLDVSRGENAIKWRRHLRICTWQLSEYKFPVIAGAFWNEVLIMVLSQCAFRHLVFFFFFL